MKATLHNSGIREDAIKKLITIMQIKMDLINTIQVWRNEMCVFFTGTLPKIERERCEKLQLVISTCEAGSVCVHAHTCVCVCLCVCAWGYVHVYAHV